MNMYLYYHEINFPFQKLISNDSFRQFEDFRLSPLGGAGVCRSMHLRRRRDAGHKLNSNMEHVNNRK